MSTEKHAQAGELTAEAFLNALQNKGLVPKNVLADLRKQVLESKTRVSARQVAKLLVDKGMLTSATAQQLLESGAKPPEKPAPADTAGQTAAAAQPSGKKAGPASPPAASAKGQPAKPPVQKPSPLAGPSADSGMASLLEEELSSLSDGMSSLGGGPLDALLSDPSLAEAVQESNPLDAPVAAKRRAAKPSALWGSRRARKRLLVWISGAAAGILAIVAIVVWLATRQDPTKVLEPADSAYQAGAWADAVQQYDAFLDRYPKLPVSGRTRVRRGLARLRLTLSETAADSTIVATARAVLPEISPEAEFDREAGTVLATLLPPLVEASASRTQRNPDPASIGQSEDILALAQLYIPAADKPRERLGRVEATLALARHRFAADDELKYAAVAIQKAAEAKDFKEARRVRTALLDAYPQFAKSDSLAETVAKVSALEQAAVAWVARPQAVEKEAAAAVSTTILIQRTFTASPPGTTGHVVLAVAAGAVYGLDASNGKVLWRAFVGFDPDGRDEGLSPKAVGPQADSDVVIAAASHREVHCVERATGRVKWRYAVPEGFCGDPVVLDDQVLVTTRSGRLVAIDATKGNSAGFAQFPRALSIAAAVDPSRKLVFQAADCDSLFVLAMPGLKCRQVLPLGHEPGSIVTPPVIMGDYLLLAVNGTAGGSSLHVLQIRSGEPHSSDPPLQLVQTIAIKGHVDAAPSILGERLLLATDNGDVQLWERSGAGGKPPLRDVASAHFDGGTGLARFPLLQADACLIGDLQLVSFEVQPPKQQLSTTWRDSSPGAVCQTPTAIGQTVFFVRHAGDSLAVVVSAVRADNGRPYWQTFLAAPLAGAPVVNSDGRTATAVTTLGGVFALPVQTSTELTVIEEPAAVRPAAAHGPVFHGTLTGVVRSGEKLAISGGSACDQVLVFDSDGPKKPLASWMLPAPLACPPIAVAGGLLAPLKVGQIYLLDPLTGNSLCVPFQPRLQSGDLPLWRAPVSVGDKEFVISDGRKKLYRLQLVDKPALHMQIAAEVELAEAIVSPLATTGKAVCGVDAAGKLDFFQLPELTRSQQHALAGPCAWGPCRVGNRILLAAEAGPCYCFDESGLLWQAALPYGRLVGDPLAVKDHLLMAAASGVVWRVEASSGKELGKVDIGRPLATGPVLWGDRIVIGGPDGSLYQISPP